MSCVLLRAPLALARGEGRRRDTQRHAFIAGGAGWPEVYRSEAAPAAFEHRVELAGCDIDEHAHLERGDLVLEIRARPRRFDDALDEPRHVPFLPDAPFGRQTCA